MKFNLMIKNTISIAIFTILERATCYQGQQVPAVEQEPKA